MKEFGFETGPRRLPHGEGGRQFVAQVLAATGIDANGGVATTGDAFVQLSLSPNHVLVAPAEPLRTGDVAIFGGPDVEHGIVGVVVHGEIEHDLLPDAAAFRRAAS